MFPNKGTSTIIVCGERYHWRVADRSQYLILYCQKTDAIKSILQVNIPSDKGRYWVKFPDVEELKLNVASPTIVSKTIEEAIKLGWDPERDEKSYIYEMDPSTNVMKIVELGESI